MNLGAGQFSSQSHAVSTGDLVTLGAWIVLAGFAWRLVMRLPRERRNAWVVVAAYSTIVAVDKAFDLQMVGYRCVHWMIDLLDAWFGLQRYRAAIRVGMLVAAGITAVGGTLWLVRGRRPIDRGCKLAIAGLLLILAMVTLRLSPRLQFLGECACWTIEGLACTMIAIGMRIAWPRAATSGSRPTNEGPPGGQ